jgi:Ca2+-binding RTX toxin-like protein
LKVETGARLTAIVGTLMEDTLVDGAGDDTITGLSRNDEIRAAAGNALLGGSDNVIGDIQDGMRYAG